MIQRVISTCTAHCSSILSTFLFFTFITNQPGHQFAHHLILSCCTRPRIIKADIGTSIVAAQPVVQTVDILKAWRPTVCNRRSRITRLHGGRRTLCWTLLRFLISVWDCNFCTFLNWDTFALLHLFVAIFNWHSRAHWLHHNLRLWFFNSFLHLVTTSFGGWQANISTAIEAT